MATESENDLGDTAGTAPVTSTDNEAKTKKKRKRDYCQECGTVYLVHTKMTLRRDCNIFPRRRLLLLPEQLSDLIVGEG
uniref:Putative ovule protein n=1 Tax=Solanum chacoense TaxID=4108 RepID=A0A0V0H8W4_SOLCH